MRIAGSSVTLDVYPARATTNRRFAAHELSRLDAVFLPPTLRELADEPPSGQREFVEDDNRGAVSREPVATLDGQPFYLSVKGIGSSVDPYSNRPLDRARAIELTGDPELRERWGSAPADDAPRLITGELWLRGSPYGGQGIEHATTALRVSERADLTSIEGFRIAPVVKVCAVPGAVAERVRRIVWYRQYPGEIVQELRLVPSNVRIYFHARQTLGAGVRHVFDLFGLDSSAAAVRFETNLLRSGVALLTLFARSLTHDPARDRYSGLDFHDVWLDKDAVVAPDGTIYFVDLEGIDEVSLEPSEVRERMEDQIYRSLYELTFAYEQVEEERVRRFGDALARRPHFERVVTEAVREDPYVALAREGRHLTLEVRNRLRRENLYFGFRLSEGERGEL